MVKVTGPLKPGSLKPGQNIPDNLPEETRVSLESALKDVRSLAVVTVGQAKQDGSMNAAVVVGAGVKEAFDRSLDVLKNEVPAGRKAACAAGCAHCCHLPVVTDAITVLAIANKVKSWPKSDRKRLTDKLRERAAKRAGMSAAAQRLMRAPCPLLDDGMTCQVYAERPLICRAFNSFDASRCERQFLGGGHPEGVDLYRLPYLIGEVLTEGAEEGYDRADLDPADVSLDLSDALLIALDADKPAEKFFGGTPIFAAARTTVKPTEGVDF